MSMLKFAFGDNVVVDAFTEDQPPKYNPNSDDAKLAGAQFAKTVQAAKKVIKKSADFLYVRTRAIGSLEKWGPNMNGDAFPMKELTSSYRTFVGKGNFIDHKSDDITKIRGLVIDAYLNNNDHCVECLIAVDKKSHPQLARDIETGVVNSVSMGTRVGWSECSCCGNVARTEKDYCSHIQTYKGMKIGFLTNNEKHKFGKYAVHEVNHDLEFIELSWVAVPAFTDAYVLEKIASLKKAVDNKFDSSIDYTPTLTDKYASESKDFSQSEEEMSNLFNNVPSSLQSVAESASCHNDECKFDARKTRGNSDRSNTKMAGEMSRVRIVREIVQYRTIPKDYGASGSIVVDNKEYKWWGVSTDKKEWNISLDEGLDKISASGQSQIVKAIREMISKNVDSTDLIVASSKSFSKTGYIHGGDDELLKTPVEEALAKGENPHYSVKDLEIGIGGDGRDWDVKNFNGTAEEGPSGKIGKELPESEKTLSKEDQELKEMTNRAFRKEFLKYLARRGKI